MRELPLPDFDDSEVVFAAPWEARAFAIIVRLSEAGYFSWNEWVECFAREVAAGTAPKTYYEQWLDAAETLLVAKGITSRSQLAARRFAIGAVGIAHVPAG